MARPTGVTGSSCTPASQFAQMPVRWSRSEISVLPRAISSGSDLPHFSSVAAPLPVPISSRLWSRTLSIFAVGTTVTRSDGRPVHLPIWPSSDSSASWSMAVGASGMTTAVSARSASRVKG
ncbi:hypothetical protein D3C81_1706410 [compost metagenome]